ncbi:unnamed protein product [Plutella xylostella]|uniref:(diamondback moth) hypothetical protein n=1 Tax=Plutella xylostella TaxID=51655 RepID=A0A8S4FW54_PLUXY|nr:unnamed protein product [Plutella xylostella]
MYLRACLVALLAVSPALAAVCPDACLCSTTRDGLHRAACSDVHKLYKFTLRQKHHNVNILDLSHNNISRLTHELDRLTEVVTLDLSTNGLTELDKFLHNAKKLVHLNLANNRFQHLSMTPLPTSVSSVDLTNNLLRDVPYDLKHLSSLEHLELAGNPLDCSCGNLLARDQLLRDNVFIDDVKCASPRNLKGKSWLELKTKSVCNVPKYEHNYLDMMMGDQPVDAVLVGEETTALKSMPLVANSDLEDGNIIQGDQIVEDDSQQFIRVKKLKYTQTTDEVEGSGDATETTPSQDIVEARHVSSLEAEEKKEDTTEDTIEGSGFEGSGFGFYNEELEKPVETTTTTPPELYTGPIVPLIPDDNTSEYPIPPPPTVYEGGPLWHSETTLAPVIERVATERSATVQLTRDTTVSEPIRVTQPSDVNDLASSEPAPHKTGTYVCIAIIIVILVGLIGFAILKGQMRKRRDRRLLRQQKRDVEKASKEMVDMNKSLLGKPALIDTPIEKKVNGKYELVPTHENNQKNGDVSNGMKHSDNKGTRTDSPRDTNQNKSSSKDNNLADDKQSSPTQQDTSFESGPTSPDSRKDTHSLSSEDIFVPLNDDDGPKLNGVDSDASQGLLNDPSFSDFLSPSREYVPVYSPDMGRVRIKLSETPKPKTPVLVTRSRSNAGDIIITPAHSPGARASAT